MRKALFIFLLIFSSHLNALTAVDIASASIAGLLNNFEANCFNYKMPTEFCMWYDAPDDFNFTPVLDHYLPDLVVVVYRNRSENPWAEINTILDSAASSFQSAIMPIVGTGNSNDFSSNEENIIFKEVDVIGNPTLAILHLPFTLPSVSQPFYPYYQSMIDSKMWRGLMPVLSHIEEGSGVFYRDSLGQGTANYGSIYPHQGFVPGNDNLRASMVVAARATDLLNINQKSYGHIYQELTDKCGEKCKISNIEFNNRGALFQPLYPSQKNTCHVLSDQSLYDAFKIKESKAYAWIVWRHYKGCADGDGKYIGKI